MTQRQVQTRAAGHQLLDTLALADLPAITASDVGADASGAAATAVATEVTNRNSAITTAVAAAPGAPGGTDVAVADGGTGASTAANARTNLGLGTAAVAATGAFDAAGVAAAAVATHEADTTAIHGIADTSALMTITVSDSDPGAVGAGKMWLTTTTGDISVRNSANSAWVALLRAG